MGKLILTTMKVVLVGVIVSFLGCTNDSDFKKSNESFRNFNRAKELLASPSKENLITAQSLLQKIEEGTQLYKDAQGLLGEIPTKLNDLENNKNNVELKNITKNELAEIYNDRWLHKFRTATEISFIGKNKRTMKVKVSFQADQANKVIHDSSLIATAKKAGIKRIEFHDWSGFSKEYLSHDIQ